MITEKALDVPKLQAGVRKNPKFQQALRILATRKRGRQDTTFRRIKRLLDLGGMKDWSQKELRQLFELLQDAGAGRIVFGTKTPRFIWTFHLQSVARAALGMTEDKRFRKDGSEILEDGMRKPSPPRVELPRIEGVTTEPVVAQTQVSTDAAPVTSPDKQMVTIKRKGMEFELDLAKMTPDSCRKFAQMLLDL